MSITNKFFQALEKRRNWQEIYYYAQRCEFNAARSTFPLDWTPEQIKNDREDCLDQAHRLYDLLEQIDRETGILKHQE